MKRHMKTHGDMGNTGKISSQLVLSKDEVGRICLKKMRGDMGNRRKIKNDKEAIEKTLFKQQEEFNRKLELGTIINNYMEKNELETAALTCGQLEALETYADYWGEIEVDFTFIK